MNLLKIFYGSVQNFLVPFVSKFVMTKIYRYISLNIVLYALSEHKPQLQKLDNHISPTQQFTACYVRNINSFTVDGFQFKLNGGR